jgi:hypothetical protein
MTMNKAIPLSRTEVLKAVRASSGYTTQDGNALGTSLIDTTLIGSNDFLTGRSIMILSGACALEMQTCSGFNAYTGEIIVSAYSRQIVGGVQYQVLVGGGGGSSITSPTLDAVYVNVLEGVAGTAAGIGTATNPVNNFVDAQAIMLSKGINKVIFTGGRRLEGSHTGILNSTVMTDSVAILIPGRYVGMQINNITDGSMGKITENTEHTVTSSALTGGGLNVWTPGDEWGITLQFGGNQTGGVSPTVMVDSTATLSPNSLVGQFLTNTTDGSAGIIMANTVDTITVNALTGGALNLWSPGDQWNVSAAGNDIIIVPTQNIYISGEGNGEYNLNVFDPTATWLVIFLNSVNFYSVSIDNAFVYVDGNLRTSQTVAVSNLGELNVHGDLIVGGSVSNTGVLISVDGQIKIRGSQLSNGSGQLAAGSIFVHFGEVYQNGIGSILCTGHCEIGGDVGGPPTGLVTVDTNAATLNFGSLKTNIILNTSNSSITVHGDCQLSEHIENSGGGSLTILGKLEINGDPGLGEGYLNNGGGGNLIVTNGLTMPGILTGGGTINVWANAFIGSAVNNGTSSIQIYGDLHMQDYVHGPAGGYLNVEGNVYCGSISIDGGNIVILGSLDGININSADTGGGPGNIEIQGNLTVSSILNDVGCSIAIGQNLTIRAGAVVGGQLQNVGSIGVSGDFAYLDDLLDNSGTLQIGGVAHILGTITNTGTLTYMGYYPEIAINVAITNPVVSNLVLLASTTKRYTIDSLVLKSVDPGVNTVTVRLWKLVNAVLTEIGSFAITTVNFATYFTLMDMFGVPTLAGDSIKITAEVSAGGPYGITGSYTVRTDNGGTGSVGVIPPI